MTAHSPDAPPVEGTPWPLIQVTTEGLRYWLDCAVEPRSPSSVEETLRPEAEALENAGLVSAAGAIPDEAQPVVDAVRNPTCTVEIEAATGSSARHFRAWIGSDCAVVFATDPPWSGAEPTAEATAAFATPASDDRELRVVDPEWVPVVLARWALITPRQVREPAELTVAQGVFHRRMSDHTEPAPQDADPSLAELWAEPLFTWGVGIEPTGDRFLILDAGKAGHRAVAAADGQVTLYGVPSLTLWHNVIGMIDRAFASR